MRSRSLSVLAALAATTVLVSLAATGCARQETTATTSEETTTPGQNTMAGGAELSDAHIAAVVVNYNNTEIEHARLAQQKATNTEVKQFAQQMITDHQAVNDKATALATKLHLTPEESDASRKLTTDGATFRDGLRTQTGADFDRSYIANEVALHEQVLNQIDNELIPSADDAELKQLLTETRPAVKAHLDHARQIQDRLAGSAGR